MGLVSSARPITSGSPPSPLRSSTAKKSRRKYKKEDPVVNFLPPPPITAATSGVPREKLVSSSAARKHFRKRIHWTASALSHWTPDSQEELQYAPCKFSSLPPMPLLTLQSSHTLGSCWLAPNGRPCSRQMSIFCDLQGMQPMRPGLCSQLGRWPNECHAKPHPRGNWPKLDSMASEVQRLHLLKQASFSWGPSDHRVNLTPLSHST